MLDPVSSTIANRSGPLSQTKPARDESRKIKESSPDKYAAAPKVKETDLLSLSIGIKSSVYSTAAVVNTPIPAAKTSQGDAVILSSDLNSDPAALKEAIDVVYDQVKSQLQKYYGQTAANAPDAVENADITPSENASAQELMEFFSPENTSQRIVGFATGFFGAYLQNHQDASREDKVNGFSDLIGGAVQQGFQEAEKILGHFDNLGEIGANIKKTYNLVMQGIEEFRQQYLNGYQIDGAETEDASASVDSTNPSSTVGE
ncbi:MAG: DUF5610 domain-containing protein [Candidatus Omnitrophota bacterium]